MVSCEINNSFKEKPNLRAAVTRYQELVIEFAQQQEEILTSAGTPSLSLSFFDRIRGKAPSIQKPTLTKENQLVSLRGAFSSLLYTDRQLVVCHLKANPKPEQSEIIADYLQSPALLKDAYTLGRFFEFWLLEFFQQMDTGSIEDLPHFIQTIDSSTLPKNLKTAQKDIFNPLWRLLDKSLLRELEEGLKTFGLPDFSQKLASELIEKQVNFPPSLIREYQKFVGQLVRAEAGLVSPRATESGPLPPKVLKREKPRPEEPQRKPPPEPSLVIEKEVPTLFMVLRVEGKPVRIATQEKLEETMKDIKGLGPVKPQLVWRKLERLRETPPKEIMIRHREHVAGGPFDGWHKIGVGSKWWIIFHLEDSSILFRLGSHRDVYGTSRRKPRDKSRSL